MSIDYRLRSRRERYVYQQLDVNRQPVGLLEEVVSCDLDWSIYNSTRGSGGLQVRTTQPVHWPSMLVRVWVIVSNGSGQAATPLMTAQCRTPDNITYTPAGWEGTVDLHELTMALDEWKLSQPFTLPAGTVVTTAVRDIFTRLGVTDVHITDSPRTLVLPKTWWPTDDQGVSWLGVINELLTKSIDYASLWTDGRGVYQCTPYVNPADRPVLWRFADDDTGQRYEPKVGVSSEASVNYNAWSFWGRAAEGADPVSAYAVNDDPSHPYSTVSVVPRREITRIETDVEGDVAAALQRAKTEDMANQRTFTIAARFVPIVENEAAEIINGDVGLRTVGTLTKRSLRCEPGESVQLTFREVS